MKKTKLTVSFITLLGLGFVCLLLRLVLNQNGFCWESKKWLSDEEKVKAVIQHQIDRRTIPIFSNRVGTLELVNVEQVPYENADAYLKQYPDCCALNPGGPYEVPPLNTFDSLQGFQGDVVVLDYYVRYEENGKKRVRKLKFENWVSNCAEVG